MPGSGDIDVIWWITVVEMPALAGLFWLVFRTRTDTARQIEEVRENTHRSEDKLWSALNAYKLDVAKNYASNLQLKEAEMRLTRHLIRIEDKLGVTFHPCKAARTSHD